MFHNEDLRSYRLICMATSPRTIYHIRATYFGLLCTDALSSVAFIVVLRRSYKHLRGSFLNFFVQSQSSFYRNKHNFVLNEKMQMRSSVSAVRYTLASTVLRFAFCDAFFFAGTVIRIVYYANDSPYFLRLINNFYVSIEFYFCINIFENARNT